MKLIRTTALFLFVGAVLRLSAAPPPYSLEFYSMVGSNILHAPSVRGNAESFFGIDGFSLEVVLDSTLRTVVQEAELRDALASRLAEIRVPLRKSKESPFFLILTVDTIDISDGRIALLAELQAGQKTAVLRIEKENFSARQMPVFFWTTASNGIFQKKDLKMRVRELTERFATKLADDYNKESH